LPGEAEIVFGFRALVLTVFIAAVGGLKPAVDCLEQQDYTELLFEFVILVIAGTRPVICLAMHLVDQVVRHLHLLEPVACYVVTLSPVPLPSSFITQLAMTLAALMLSEGLPAAFFLAGPVALGGQRNC
jgi:hypothetical protein